MASVAGTVTGLRDSSVPQPFAYHAPEEALIDLRRRIQATRWPDRETVDGSQQGAELSKTRRLAEHWATQYEWRTAESRINAHPNFLVNIDGVAFHFLHVRSGHERALPLLVAHGWPGTFIALMKIIGPLTDPTKYGGEASDAFDLVIPSMPGYGFSEKPTTPGWNPVRIAAAYNEMMGRLGYTRWGAQGGDWGAIVVEQMALSVRLALSASTRTCPARFLRRWMRRYGGQSRFRTAKPMRNAARANSWRRHIAISGMRSFSAVVRRQ